jgi:hypothetical protein
MAWDGQCGNGEHRHRRAPPSETIRVAAHPLGGGVTSGSLKQS